MFKHDQNKYDRVLKCSLSYNISTIKAIIAVVIIIINIAESELH